MKRRTERQADIQFDTQIGREAWLGFYVWAFIIQNYMLKTAGQKDTRVRQNERGWAFMIKNFMWYTDRQTWMGIYDTNLYPEDRHREIGMSGL
jgi:hypothetical protein